MSITMFFLKALLLLLFFINPVAASDDPHRWKLVKHEDGIKVYTRTLSHSNYKQFRGEMDFNGNMEQLLAFINDAERCPDWRYKCIKMLQLSDGYIYKLSNLPWPLNDRYTVMQSQLGYDQQNNSYTLALKNVKRELLPAHIQAKLPEPGNTVQMRYSDGFWQLKLNDNASIHITYQMHGDPAGVIPAALANQGVTNAAFVTLSKLKKHFKVRQNVNQ